ncbi:MAG: hypothetical protein U9N34_10755, partial [Candidatus Cloacimonadota bacterium]|nr:hypothetical protein [Candidatus Cloacimonadota bacterium]
MAFSKTDFRQFIDEIQMIRNRKEFSGTWKEHLKGLGFQLAEKALEKKRKGYDHLYTNIFRKYGIVPDDLYSALDKFWKDGVESTKVLRPPAIVTVSPIIYSVLEYAVFWKDYVDATIKHAHEVGERE